MAKKQTWIVEALITRPFRVTLNARIQAVTLNDAVVAFGKQYPEALITSASEEIDYGW